MKAADCDRWEDLSDRAAIGDPLSVEDERLLRDHVTHCAACAAEARAWEGFGRLLSPDSDAPQIVDPRAARPRRWLRWGVAAAAMVAAAGVAVGLGLRSPTPEPPVAGAPDDPVSLVLVSGSVQVHGVQAAAGAALRPGDVVRVARGRACLVHAPGISACAGEDSAVRLIGAVNGRRHLALESGVVVCRLDGQPSGTRFSVETPLGRVTAKGTVFSVERVGSSEVLVRVHRGVVEIESAGGSVEEIQAPASAVLGSEIRRTPPTGPAWQRDRQLSGIGQLWAEGAVAPVEIGAVPQAARVRIDGIDLGQSPVSTLVGRGDHDLTVDHPGYLPSRDHFRVQGAERVVRVVSLTPEPAVAVAEQPAPTASAAPSAADRLARARSLRRSGRYGEAAAAYQQLIGAHPGSAEARAALVSLGELQISALGQPAAALRSFESYLAGGGPLTQEARYGRIRALRQLGRAGEARDAAQQFVRDYPGSAQSRSLEDAAGQR
jgi:ferric-dicitrate binding protein FerR (iron transport regulator)